MDGFTQIILPLVIRSPDTPFLQSAIPQRRTIYWKPFPKLKTPFIGFEIRESLHQDLSNLNNWGRPFEVCNLQHKKTPSQGPQEKGSPTNHESLPVPLTFVEMAVLGSLVCVPGISSGQSSSEYALVLGCYPSDSGTFLRRFHPSPPQILTATASTTNSVEHQKMSSISSNSSNISFSFSPDTSTSSFTTYGSHIVALSEPVQIKEGPVTKLRVPTIHPKPLAPKLSKRTAAHPIIQRDWYQVAEIGLILYLDGTSSASIAEKNASLHKYSLALEASLHAHEYRKQLAYHAERYAVSAIRSIRKWWTYNKMDSYLNQPRPILPAVASVSY
ncbi:hypothetical protein PSTG_14176 [Puccinia striiformis f. sp. tritici PST-78]|uniref:Uncharacterized protein n=1 Tax=Puccinia striiformis f. sp. tritici PST-78 TaxID=1165861 RepID=A0A0L0UZM0_9BASI|nr:hypothetical protein PSTG_14176 [Puccinia striiformis f. sp. tritici PST-78]